MPRVGWIRALIANRLRNEPRFTRDDTLSMIGLHMQARDMRIELTMIRRLLEDQNPAGVTSLVEGLQRLEATLARHKAAIREGFEGNLDYWRGEP